MDTMVMCLCLLQALYSDTSDSWNEKIAQDIPDRISVCVSVLDAAVEMSVPPNLAAAVAWRESKFNNAAVSKAGARGAMQVLPKYWCPDGKLDGCDLVREGVRSLGVYLKKYGGDEKDALCHYNSGNKCTRKSRNYSKRVIRAKKRLDFLEALLSD